MESLDKNDKKYLDREIQNIWAGDLLWHNTKLLEDWVTIQKKLGFNIRVQYVIEWAKIRILNVFKKNNHVSHR